MTRYGEITNPNVTPQNEAARTEQVENSAGGFVFEIDKWKQLDRFLILGQVGATYYASEREVVKDNAAVIEACLAEDGARTVRRICSISESGRAPKNDPAIYALALAAGAKDKYTRSFALRAIPVVCRIGTHLFHFAADVNALRGWGRGLRRAIAEWYSTKNDSLLAMQAIKYQQRDGWGHRNLLQLAHPTPKDERQAAAFRWMIGGGESLAKEGKRPRNKPIDPARLHPIFAAYDELHAATEIGKVVNLIIDHKLPREAVPTKWLNDPDVWAALLPHMGLTAIIRNLGKMTSIGFIKPLSFGAQQVCVNLTDPEFIAKQRVHPMQFLLAQGVYRQGHGEKGKLRWTPVQAISDALDAGFYEAFKHIEPTGKSTLIALDISGSMDGGLIAGCPGITPRVAAAAMAMVTARAEKNWAMIGFTDGGHRSDFRYRSTNPMNRGTGGLTMLDISANERLDSVVAKMRALPMGGTDCAVPMIFAGEAGLDVDIFQVYTDNETWAGDVHPFQALRAYRQKSGRDAKLAVVGLTATKFSIADPSDPGMLDVVGMDSHAPSLMASFARGDV